MVTFGALPETPVDAARDYLALTITSHKNFARLANLSFPQVTREIGIGQRPFAYGAKQD
jgi:hypothetical protein